MISTVSNRPTLDKSLISIVLPVYNEAAVLHRLYQSITDVLTDVACRFEIIFVNDGSSDSSAEILDELAAECHSAKVLHFSRNFGHQAAVQAGLNYASGDAVIIMDSDMQDDPGVLGRFLEQWQLGYDVVYAVRFQRKERLWKRTLFFSFYRILNLVSDIQIPKDSGVFGLIDRSVCKQITAIIDRDRYFPGLRSWVGFRQIGIPVERHARHDDHPRVTLIQLFRLAKSAVFSFSAMPLMMFYGISAVSMLVFLGCCGFSLYHKLFTGLAVPGWTSITTIASFFGMLNALGIGILGEYVIRIYDQVRARPQYIVARQCNFTESAADADGGMLDWLADQRAVVEASAPSFDPVAAEIDSHRSTPLTKPR